MEVRNLTLVSTGAFIISCEISLFFIFYRSPCLYGDFRRYVFYSDLSEHGSAIDLTELSKSPAGVAKSNKQWMGTIKREYRPIY